MNGDAPPAVTFHLLPAATWEGLDREAEYAPESLALEGFIHCTDGAQAVADTANRYFRQRPEPFVVLEIERGRIRAPWRYDDPQRIFTHIYGALNLDAVRRALPMPRTPDGGFLPPI